MEDMPELSGGESYTSDGDPDEYLQHYEELRKYLMKQRAKREKEEMLKSDGVGKGGRPYRKSISPIKFEPATPAKVRDMIVFMRALWISIANSDIADYAYERQA